MSNNPSPSTSTSAGDASQFSSQLPGSVCSSTGACTARPPPEPEAAAQEGGGGEAGTPVTGALEPFPPDPVTAEPAPPEPAPPLRLSLQPMIARSARFSTLRVSALCSIVFEGASNLHAVQAYSDSEPQEVRGAPPNGYIGDHRASWALQAELNIPGLACPVHPRT
jgi:hypothetical protein